MTVEQILEKATQFTKEKKSWHFHILTPTCMLNSSDKYVLVVENLSDDQEYSVVSAEPYMGIGEKLVKLLHGDDVVVNNTSQEELQEPSVGVKKLVQRGKQLSEKNIFWHHHMLFPGCKFNQEDGKYVIMFEDQENDEIIKSVSDAEPKSDLKHIEALFYGQKK